MKRSEKILRKNNIPEGLPELERQLIKNTTLIEHLINNDLKHIWWWIRAMAMLLFGLSIKLLIGG